MAMTTETRDYIVTTAPGHYATKTRVKETFASAEDAIAYVEARRGRHLAAYHAPGWAKGEWTRASGTPLIVT